jgi:hypothetical protein
VPPKAKAATTKTEQKPWKPLAKAPGLSGSKRRSQRL